MSDHTRLSTAGDREECNGGDDASSRAVIEDIGPPSANRNSKHDSSGVPVVGDVSPLIPAFMSATKSQQNHGAFDKVQQQQLEQEQEQPVDSLANSFRYNIEGIEKPRQILALVATIAGASYLVS